jgi:type II secretory pathway component PulC
MLLQQAPPVERVKKLFVKEREIQTAMAIEGIESIYKNDLFGTFQKEDAPLAKSLITPIPQLKTVSIQQPKEPPKPQFLPPLNIELKGVAFSSDEEKSICMITDETGKEQVYHVGDIVKDAQVIRIVQNRITLLRPNGQHETILIRKSDEAELTGTAVKGWEQVVKRIDGGNYEVDIRKFPEVFPTLGVIIENFGLLTVYKEGKPYGVKISRVTKKGIGPLLGLMTGDILKEINNIDTSEKKSRLKIYDMLTNSKKESSITLSLLRSKKPLKLTYKLTDIVAVKDKEFMPGYRKDKRVPPSELFHMSELQERENRRREFHNTHSDKQDKAIEEIRSRLLENVRSRTRDARVR